MIYADFNGSTPVCGEVRDFLVSRLKDNTFANPSSVHSMGKRVLFKMEKARRSLAKSLSCDPSQIILTSGASESITQIFHSTLNSTIIQDQNIIISSDIEHSAVNECCELYKSRGFQVIKLKTLSSGVVDLNHLKELLSLYKDKIALLTTMAANNENGIIQPYKEIGKLAHDNGVLFFSDTTQFIGKAEFSFFDSNIDFAVLSSHKIGALIGSGIIIAKDPNKIKPLILGGGQENGLRGGTQNYIGMEAMAIAMESLKKNISNLPFVSELRMSFEAKMKTSFPSITIIGENSPRLPTTTMISYPGIPGNTIQIELEEEGIYTSTSSACSDKKTEISNVLKSMGVPREVGLGVLRISICCHASQDDYKEIEIALTRAYQKLSKHKSLLERL